MLADKTVPAGVYLDDPDPLSVLCSRLDLRAEVYANSEFCGTWAVDTGGSKRIPFHLVGHGDAWLHLEGRQSQQLRAGDIVIFPYDDHHLLGSGPDVPAPELHSAPALPAGEGTHLVCGFFEFRNRSVFPLLESLSAVICLRGGEADCDPVVSALVTLMLGELERQQQGYYAAIDQYAQLLFLQALRQEFASAQPAAGMLAALFDPRIGRALSAMHQHPEQQWSVASLAEVAAMSRSAFAQRFSQLLDVSPLKYLTLWRMCEARRLLAHSAVSVAELAQRSGYESEAAFRKAYKNALGETPGATREAARAE
jgi:AraC-like DNA-binding protein